MPHELEDTRHRAPRGWVVGLAAVGLLAVVAAAFYPSLGNGFCYDDETNIVRNMKFRGFGRDQLAWMWTTFKGGHYQPLSWMSLALDYLIWGERPFGYHLTNLILHAANTLLVFGLGLRLFRGCAPRATVAESPTPAVRQAHEPGWGTPANDRLTPIRAGPSSAPVPDGSGLGNMWGTLFAAAIGALLFAVHPLRVESVAWATERRDVLSSFFLLTSVLLYLKAQSSDTRSAYFRCMAASLAVFALSLLSRAMGVTLPIILLVLDAYPLGRWRWGPKGSGPFDVRGSKELESAQGFDPPRGQTPRGLTPSRPTALGLIWEKTPYLILAVGAAIVAPIAQQSVGATVELAHHGIVARAAQSCYGLVFYLGKTAVPFDLAPMYELRTPLAITAPKYLLSACAVAVGFLALGLLARRARAVAAAGLCYLILLLPVLGLFQSGRQEVADRYSYLPGVVIALLVGGGIARLQRAAGFTPAVHTMRGATNSEDRRDKPGGSQRATGFTPAVRRIRYAAICLASCAVVVALTVLTWRQCRIWKDAESLWTHTIAHAPPSATAHYNLAALRGQQGRTAEARDGYIRALEINPRYPDAHYHLGNMCLMLGDLRMAERAFLAAVRIQPSHASAWYHLGNALADQGKVAPAVAAYREAVKFAPRHVESWINLGGQLWKEESRDEAIAAYQEAVRVDPRRVDARLNLGGALAATGRTDEGLAELREAVRLEPQNEEAGRRLKALEAHLGMTR